jgi:hypothetical protein
MAASQNGFCSYKHSIDKKTNIMQIMTKNITFLVNLIFYHTEKAVQQGLDIVEVVPYSVLRCLCIGTSCGFTTA